MQIEDVNGNEEDDFYQDADFTPKTPRTETQYTATDQRAGGVKTTDLMQ